MVVTLPSARRLGPIAILGATLLLVGFVTGIGVSRRASWPVARGERASEGAILPAPEPGPRSSRSVAALQGSYSELVKAVMPAVVNIFSTRVVRSPGAPNPFFGDPFFRHFFGEGPSRQQEVPRERREQSLGSGVIVSADGYVMTNNHVIAGADEVRVTLADRREMEARVVGADPKTDLAVLKLEARNLPHLALGDSDQTEVGEVVLALGNPFGLGQTVTLGIISAKGRANMGIADYEDFIQTDAAINPGNSGGALVNTQGELIGINTAIASRTGGYQGVGFAIPSNMARDVSQNLIKDGRVRRGYLGVVIQPVTPALAEAFKLKEARGALVGDVAPNTPAARGGLRRGDVVIEYEGEEVEDSAQLRLRVARTPIGSTASLVVLRDGQRVPLKVTVGELEEEETQARGGAEAPSGALQGIAVGPLTADLARRLDLPRSVSGVVVSEVQPGSAAEEAGLRLGDVIREVNRKPVGSVTAYQAAARAAGRGAVVLLIQRGDSTAYVTVR